MKRNNSEGNSESRVSYDSKSPIAILGYCMDLPCKSQISGDDLVEIIKKKEFVGQDYLETGILHPWQYAEDGNPWMFHHRKGLKYKSLTVGDQTLMQVSDKESKFLALNQSIALDAVWRALENSGIPISLLQKTKTGVFVASYSIFGGFQTYPNETALRGGLMSGTSDRIAYFLGTHGPSVTVETACSSSLVALTLAVDSIRNGSSDVAIVASINRLSTEYDLALQATGVVSSKGECRPFDEDASGTLRCEGFGCIIVCSMEWARKNKYSDTIQTVIINSTIGSAGADPKATHGSGRVYESPNAHGMAEMIQLCHRQVDLPVGNVQYVEAHATGTPVGDLIELEALAKVYKKSHDIQANPLRIGSLKGNIGHAEIAAGMFSLIKVIEMLKRRTFLPTGGHLISPRKDFAWDENNIRLCLDNEPFPANQKVFIGVNSFGVGGSYAHTIVSEYCGGAEDTFKDLKKGNSQVKICPLLFIISAASTRHLEEYENRLLTYLHDHPGALSLLDLCGLFSINRSRLSYNRQYLVESIDDLMGQLAASDSKGGVSEGIEQHNTVAMVFTGQGAQWRSMGSGLMVFKAYRTAVTQFDGLYRKLSGWSPLSMLMSLEDDQISETIYAQPLTFMVQLGLVELLKYFGVTASVVAGHSAGEIAALYCCGLLSLEESARVIYQRSHCQQAIAGNGRMLAVQMNYTEATKTLKETSLSTKSCQIACINSPNSVVIAGPEADLMLLKEYLASKQVKNTLLKGNTAFHSSFMDPILIEVDKKLAFLNKSKKLNQGNIPFLSTVTALPQSFVSSEYMVHNIRQPVRFLSTVEYMMNHFEPDVVVEIGPHKTLAPLLVECIQAADQKIKVLPSLGKGQDDVHAFWKLVMGLVDSGIRVDLSCLYRDLGYKFSEVASKNVPGHPFLDQYSLSWLDKNKGTALGKWDLGPAAGTFESENIENVSSVEISKATCQSMTDHVMGGQAILPGMYYVEASIEAAGLQDRDCLVMSDVEFHEMCPIPDRSKKQDPRRLFVKQSTEKTNGLTKFSVESRSLGSLDNSVHCTGAMVCFERPSVLDGSQYLPGRKGFKEKRGLTRDIGQEGIKNLLESHHSLYSMKKIYDVINEDGTTEYGPSFKVVDEVRASHDRLSIVASLEFNHEQWTRRGGIYGVQLLDGILQLGYLYPNVTSGNVMYAGGFELGIFARRPSTNPCIVHFQFREDGTNHGKTVILGDAMMYDSNGRLICHLVQIKSIMGKRVTRTFDAVPVWQPISLPRQTENIHTQCIEDQGRKSSLVTIIFNLLRNKNALLRGRDCSYLRILEYWEGSPAVPAVFEKLASVDEESLPSDFKYLVEIFIATHNESVLHAGYHIPPKNRRWLKVRLVSLPSCQEVIDLLCFDIIAGWNRGDSSDQPWEETVDFVKNSCKIGCQRTLLIHDLKTNHSWDGYVENRCDYEGGFSSCRLLKEALLKVQSRKKTVLITSNDSSTSSKLCHALDSLAGDYPAEMMVNATTVDGRYQQEGIPQFVEKLGTDEHSERHIVVLDGMRDDSKYAQDTFTLVSRIAHTIGRRKSTNLWVITCNSFVPPINVHRGSLLPLVVGINSSFPNIQAKYVDISDQDEIYRELAFLILSNPGPHQYLIDNDGILHHRIIMPYDIGTKPSRIKISSKDPEMCFKCDLITSDQTGMVGYDFFADKVQSPGRDEVLVEICYTSLNFRDVMLTLNALPTSSFEASFYGYNLGMEASGVVVSIGDGVEHVAVGDQVGICAKGTLASKLIVPANSVIKLDGLNISLKDAACLSSVYSTAYHALIELCNLKKGERVLVHAAAGGVGHAAISICTYIGAEIYATSSRSKRQYCANALGVPMDHLFDSRSVTWFDELMRATDDEGVDVVINSLAGDHQRLGVQCLRPGGRFCEIGKADIFNNEKLFLFAFRKNIRMFAIDMDRMALESYHSVQNITSLVFHHVSRGDFRSLPAQIFPMDKLKDALDLMKSGSHIGKVLLANDSGEQPVQISSKALVHFDREAFHLVLGGAGGFGSKIIRWMFRKGARNFITTVSKDPSRVTTIYQDLVENGASFRVIEADLACEEDLQKIKDDVMNEPVNGRVETMVHSAGIYEPFFFEDIANNALEKQGNIKVQSAIFLDHLSRQLDMVKNFIIVGSNSSEFTAPSMATYSATNGMLGSIARNRECDGLPVTILHMGSLKDVGIVAKDESTLSFQKKTGYEFLNSARALTALEKMLSQDISSILHAMFQPFAFSKSSGTGWVYSHMTPTADSIVIFGGQKNASGGGMQASYNQTLERVTWLLVDSMGLDKENVTSSTTLSSLGVDSLGILEFRQHVQDEFGYTLDRSAFAMTVGDLSKEVYNKVKELSGKQENGTMVGDIRKESAGESMANKDVAPVNEEGTYLKRFYTVTNPKGYVVIFPGADQKGLYFADWKINGVQALIVDFRIASIDPKLSAQTIASELHADGYLDDARTKIVLLGYSIGCYLALETCRELLIKYHFTPRALVPICNVAPQTCKNRLNLLPRPLSRALMKRTFHRQILREYGVPDPEDIVLYSVYLQRPSFETMFQWERDSQVYIKSVCQILKNSREPYIGNTPVHYIYAINDQVGNPKRISDPMKHGWADLTSGPFKVSAWYGKHSSLVDPIVGALFQNLALDAVQNLIDQNID